MPPVSFEQILVLKDRVAAQSDQIGRELAEGTPPEKLVPLLKTQAETIAQFRIGLADLAQSPSLAGRRDELQTLKQAFQNLVHAAEHHVRQATQKGVRVSGIGGKPYVPKRRPKTS